MNFVFVSYDYLADFSTPQSWLKRIEGYTGVYECLAKLGTVHDVKQINYEGIHYEKGVKYHFVSFDHRRKHFALKLNKYVGSLNPDIVFVHGLHQPLQLIQLRLILDKKTKIIVQHHAEKPFLGIKKYIQRIAGIGVDAYLFAAHGLSVDWIKGGNLSAAKKIYEVMEVSSIFYPVEKEVAKLKTGVSGHPVFLWVGRLNENKDPVNVVKAFLKFAYMEPTAKLYMIYHTEELLMAIKSLLKDHPQQEAVVLVGQVPHSDLLYWFNSAEFIISGSFYEGSGTAICEAMSCRCIPIVTDIFSFRMVTDGGKCGALYEAGNEKALLAALMQTAATDIQEKQKRCLSHFKLTLSFEAIAQQIYEIANAL